MVTEVFIIQERLAKPDWLSGFPTLLSYIASFAKFFFRDLD